MTLRLKISKNPFNLSGSDSKIASPLSDIAILPQTIDEEVPIGNVTPTLDEVALDLAIQTLNPVEEPNGIVTPLPFDINLSKKFYGYKNALENLDEEFVEFNLTKYTAKDFFNIFDRFFYQLDKDTLLNPMLGRSGNYIGGYINPRTIEIANLNNELNTVQDQIDSIEKEHPYFKNGKVIAPTLYKDNISAAINEGNIYYMQSAKRRQILNKDVYRGMKNRLGKSTSGNTNQTTDKDFIIFVGNIGLIPLGPPIYEFNDIYTPPGDSDTNNITLYLNRFIYEAGKT